MACGVPVAATDATAMRDHIRGGRGFPIKPDYSIIDPFGNGNRYFASISRGAMALERIYTDKVDMEKAVNAARKYVEKMTWDEPILLLDEAIQCLAKPEEKNVEEIQESKPA
jgi:glycosyltransferase involved in cell wall biosynthesis